MSRRSPAFPSLALLLALAAGGAPAHADAASAAAQMPDPPTPFLVVAMDPTDDLDRAVHLPEYAVYGDGTLLLQKSDQRLWVGRLSREQTLDLLSFVLDDARLPRVSMTYLPPLPRSTWREYRVTTKAGTTTARRRIGGIAAGPGVADGERAVQRVDDRVYALADLADQVLERPRLRVASRRVVADAAPAWTLGEAVPFAAFGDATDLARGGTIVDATESALVERALAQSRTWRLGTEAREFRFRPEFPEEVALPGWRAPARGEPAPAEPPRPDVPSVPPPPAPAPVPAPAPAPTAAADDLDYAGVQRLFEDLKRKPTGSPHGTFWKKPYADFVAYEFKTNEGDTIRLVKMGDGAGSNLVHGLRGEPLEATTPDGKTRTIEGKIMPPKGAPMPPADIARLVRWIDHGCPETGGAAPAAPPPSGPEPAAAGKAIALEIVGRGAVPLPAGAKPETTSVGPTLFVAADEGGWKALFDSGLRLAGGAHGAALADGLRDLRDAVRGYDFASSPLLLIVGPAAYEDVVEVGPSIEVLPGGAGRLTASPRRDVRALVEVDPPPPVRLHWTLWRAASKPPASLSLHWAK